MRFCDRSRRLATICEVGVLVFVISAADVRAQHYANKQLRMVIPSGPGNAYDAYARALSRHLVRHIPGTPTIVNQNMPGASGMTAMNWAYNVSPKDGSVIVGTTNVVLAEPLYANPSARFEPLKFGLIGSIAKQQNVCVTWHSRPIKTIKDAMTNEVTVSATGAATNAAVLPKIFNALLGTKFKVITGYTTNAERLAVERGEVDGVCGLSWTTIKARSSNWVSNNLINVLIQTGVKPQSGLENVPIFADLVADATDKKIVALLGFPEEMGRPFLMPPDTPSALLNEIRRAFDVTMRDPQFRADIEKSLLDIDPVSGEAMERILKHAYSTPKDLVEKAAQLRTAGQ